MVLLSFEGLITGAYLNIDVERLSEPLRYLLGASWISSAILLPVWE